MYAWQMSSRWRAWDLVNGDKMNVEDNDDDNEEEAEDDVKLRVAEEAIYGIGSARDGGGGVCCDGARGASSGGGAHRGVAGRHWAAEMEKALAYQRNIGRREASRFSDAHHRLERRRTVHC
jgi:hypothetical protein